ncbi:hypothetical protein PM082_009927 [Marasmius tenuissimus]|nr:hypothetical protein PM082_009927 [Marasmius tenuissimus]
MKVEIFNQEDSTLDDILDLYNDAEAEELDTDDEDDWTPLSTPVVATFDQSAGSASIHIADPSSASDSDDSTISIHTHTHTSHYVREAMEDRLRSAAVNKPLPKLPSPPRSIRRVPVPSEPEPTDIIPSSPSPSPDRDDDAVSIPRSRFSVSLCIIRPSSPCPSSSHSHSYSSSFSSSSSSDFTATSSSSSSETVPPLPGPSELAAQADKPSFLNPFSPEMGPLSEMKREVSPLDRSTMSEGDRRMWRVMKVLFPEEFEVRRKKRPVTYQY